MQFDVALGGHAIPSTFSGFHSSGGIGVAAPTANKTMDDDPQRSLDYFGFPALVEVSGCS
jgi:hypothetical protein